MKRRLWTLPKASLALVDHRSPLWSRRTLRDIVKPWTSPDSPILVRTHCHNVCPPTHPTSQTVSSMVPAEPPFNTPPISDPALSCSTFLRRPPPCANPSTHRQNLARFAEGNDAGRAS
ncbi:hypothetical protein OF83DRAFT_590317 [Amylostereum chailletii]|nr:hypothetical protein OF83DRAFT_590317 [Amylostereum chailletii]